MLEIILYEVSIVMFLWVLLVSIEAEKSKLESAKEISFCGILVMSILGFVGLLALATALFE